MVRAAPLVRSRTRDVDFRYLAFPAELNERERAWIDRRVQSAMVYPEKLRERKYRWVFSRGDNLALAGVVCLNRELADDRTMQFTVDASGRDIYLFAGYVFSGRTDVPMDAQFFATLLEFVERHWDDHGFARSTRPESALSPAVAFDRELPDAVPAAPGIRMKLYQDHDPVRAGTELAMFPTSNDDDLWMSAVESDALVSLCLGLPNRRYAVDGVFNNVTVEGLREPELVRRAPEPVPTADRPDLDAREPTHKGGAPAAADAGRHDFFGRCSDVFEWFENLLDRRKGPPDGKELPPRRDGKKL